jgi:hypothetical protein
MGHGLQRLTRARHGKLPFIITEGSSRSVIPLIAAKNATECNIAVRNHVPVLKHMNEYKKQPTLFNLFLARIYSKYILQFFPQFSSNKNQCFLNCFYAKYTMVFLKVSELFWPEV